MINVGFQAFISIEVDNMGYWKLHRKLLLKNNMVIIENLTHLGEVGNEIFTFVALPLKYENADGAPIRAIAIQTK